MSLPLCPIRSHYMHFGPSIALLAPNAIQMPQPHVQLDARADDLSALEAVTTSCKPVGQHTVYQPFISQPQHQILTDVFTASYCRQPSHQEKALA